jgi:hypothetical protein
MKINRLSVLIAFAVIVVASSAPAVTRAATDARGKLGNLMPPSLNHSCVLFTIVNVSEADPVNPGNPWFAIAATHPGFDKLYALLITAKSLTTPSADPFQPNLIVQTTGNAICGGFAEVNYLYWTG